jgi:hypothetical protein
LNYDGAGSGLNNVVQARTLSQSSIRAALTRTLVFYDNCDESIMTTTAILIGLILISVLANTSCVFSTKNVFYGRQTINLPGGVTLYVKTMVWGMTSDHGVTVISADNELYDFRESRKDFVFPSNKQAIYYRLEGDTLKLFDYVLPIAPSVSQFPIKVEFVEMNIMDDIKMRDNPKDLGVTKLDIVIDNNL